MNAQPDASTKPQLADLFRDLKPRSQASVGEALRLLRHPGVGATLVIQIPPDTGRPCEIILSTGPATLSVDLSRL